MIWNYFAILQTKRHLSIRGLNLNEKTVERKDGDKNGHDTSILNGLGILRAGEPDAITDKINKINWKFKKDIQRGQSINQSNSYIALFSTTNFSKRLLFW